MDTNLKGILNKTKGKTNPRKRVRFDAQLTQCENTKHENAPAPQAPGKKRMRRGKRQGTKDKVKKLKLLTINTRGVKTEEAE